MTSNIDFFLEFFSQLISTTGSWNISPDSSENYRIFACVWTQMALIIFSEVAQTSPISHFKAMTICYQNHLAPKYTIQKTNFITKCLSIFATGFSHVKYMWKFLEPNSLKSLPREVSGDMISFYMQFHTNLLEIIK